MRTRLATLLALTSAATLAHAEPAPLPHDVHVDLEIDPTAYALSGYSLHAGIGYRQLRLDVGAFGMALPAFAVNNDAFDVSFSGFGAKLQYFPLHEQRGGFVGIDAGVLWSVAERTGTTMAARDRQASVGIHAGWRFTFADRFYATPWLGVSRAFGVDDVMLGGSTYKPDRIQVFPAVHLGVRFQ